MKHILLMLPGVILYFSVAGCADNDGPPPSAATAETTDDTPASQTLDPEPNPGDAGPEEPQTVPTSALDAMELYRQAQAEMEEGEHEAGYATAKLAMQQFIAEENDLAWLLLESTMVGDKKVDIHFNMGPRERVPPDIGIVRPLSFRIWSTDDPPALLEVIDFEIGWFDGQAGTAAIGITDDSGHANLGILDVDASYGEIKQAVLDVVSAD